MYQILPINVTPTGDWNDCYKEEAALKRITEYNRMQDELPSGLIRKIAVPALLSHINGVEIGCDRHHAFLMEFINGVQSNKRKDHPFTPDIALVMYNQLKPSIDLMASLGISHHDINDRNLLVDASGSYWIVDFGHVFFFDEYVKRREKKLEFQIGTWLYYAPDFFKVKQR